MEHREVPSDGLGRRIVVEDDAYDDELVTFQDFG